MSRDPILAIRTLPPGDGYGVTRIFKVEGGLCYFKSNKAPYFSLAYTAHRKGFPRQCYSGGAGHEEILKYYPRFADLAALHLSDIDGAPPHAGKDSWYWFAGACANLGERYHGNNGLSTNSADECLQIFADYVRIPLTDALEFKMGAMRKHDYSRDFFNTWIEDQKPRWKREAIECIDKHNLKIYGDPWEAAA